jgi:hypothetical protein
MSVYCNSLKRLVDVTGIEPVTPCLQRTGVLSNRSLPLFWFPMFSTIWGICFSLEAKPNAMKTFHSCTVGAQSCFDRFPRIYGIAEDGGLLIFPALFVYTILHCTESAHLQSLVQHLCTTH